MKFTCLTFTRSLRGVSNFQKLNLFSFWYIFSYRFYLQCWLLISINCYAIMQSFSVLCMLCSLPVYSFIWLSRCLFVYKQISVFVNYFYRQIFLTKIKSEFTSYRSGYISKFQLDPLHTKILDVEPGFTSFKENTIGICFFF